MFKIITVFALLTTLGIRAQVNFDNYSTLKSYGTIPTDFTTETFTKLEADLKEGRDNLSKTEEKIFLQGTNYAIDEILHSGLVIYGDPITLYVNEIADKLLRNDGALRSKLRFYTIKSNAANAFSTDQGIVFVTTGLISQLTNEAQLAFILAHEISHYTEKHVVETFDWKTKNYRQNDRIENLSQYSQDKEFEADKLGAKMYNEAGYSPDEIFSTFDVLMYSYLPFDEVEFPMSYFNSDKMFIPKTLFPDKKYEITAIEDYNDETSSHPNIKKRKEAIEEEVGAFTNWGDATQTLGNDRFILIRNIARFESVRSDIIDANYGEALYSVFLLEKDFPNSIYLKRMKAQIWLNLMLYKSGNKSSQTINKTSELEGESAAVHFFLKKLSKDALVTIAIRQVYDVTISNPDDAEIKAVYSKFVKELAYTESFKLETYSKKKFSQAAEDFLKEKADTLKPVVADSVTKAKSKYDKIKNKKNIDNPAAFDTTKFYLYGLSDLIADSSFLSLFNDHVSDKKDKEKKKDEFNALSNSERKKLLLKNEQNEMKLGIEEIIVVEPKVYSSNRYGVNLVKSEKIEGIFSNVIESSALESGVKVYSIDRRNLASKGTESFNERSVLITFLSQIAQEDDINVFPVDFSELNEIQQNYGTSKVMFTLIEHQKAANINWWVIGTSAVLYPSFPFVILGYLPMAIFKSNHTELNLIILDLEKGIVENAWNYYWDEPIYKHNLGSHMYNIFSNLKSKPL